MAQFLFASRRRAPLRLGAAVLVGLAACTAGTDSVSGPTGAAATAEFSWWHPLQTVASVSVTPQTSTMNIAQTLQFTAVALSSSGAVITGKLATWTSSDTTVVTVNATGLATAKAAGSATVTATISGKAGHASVTVAGTVAVSTPPGTVANLSVVSTNDTSATLTFTQVTNGTGGAASYDVRYAVAPISWGSAASTTRGTCTTPLAGTSVGSAMTCTVLGLTSGTSYNFQVVAFRGTLNQNAVFGGLSNVAAGTTTTAAAPAPKLNQVILTPASVSLSAGSTQQFAVSGVWSNGATTAPTVTWSATGGTITAGGLYTAGATAGTFSVIAVQQGGTLADTSAVTITAAASTAKTLLSEGFENGSLGSRGWFDATTVAVTTDARPGSAGTHALQWHWTAGSVSPEGTSRYDFTPSNSVYLSYWVKFSSNWVGSGQTFHPHMFSFLTTADDHYIGPSITHLTLYDELLYLNGNLHANLAVQDALMINAANLNVDLRGVTEQRSIGGYNGRHEFDDATSSVTWDEYLASAGQYTNYKFVMPKAVTISDAAKNGWHHIESYWQMNTVVGGIGQQDGVLQYWVDGVQQVDRHDVYYRTGANPTMQFRTFLMGPWIGSGSPVDQYMWIDDLLVATGRP